MLGPRVLRTSGLQPGQEWLAAQATRDGAGFAYGEGGGVGVGQAEKVLGLVEQAVGQMYGVLSSRRLVTAVAKAAAADGSWS